jgi:TolA-binding protein
MQSNSKILSVGLLCLSLSACVTTRDQLNEERGVGTETTADIGGPKSGAVKSEDLSPKAKAPIAQAAPEVVVPNAPPAMAPAPQVMAPGAGALPVPGPVTGTPKAAQAPDVSTYTPDELRVEVARLTGQVEEIQHEKQSKDQEHQSEISKSQARIAELEKKLKELQPDAPVVPEGKTPFEAGKDAYLANNCDEAITFFGQALAKSDTGKEAEEATYDRGECYFKKLQYNKAIVDFSHFPEKYQKSSFHPKALLGIAESFEAMGRKDDAKAFYSDLVDKFPKTAEGKLAKKRLKAKK